MKKTLSLLLAVIMVLSMIPVAAFAEETTTADGSISAPYVYETAEALAADWNGRTIGAGETVYVQAPLGGETLSFTSDTGALALTNTMAAFAYETDGTSYTFSEDQGFTAGQVVTMGIWNQHPYSASVATLTLGAAEGGEEGGEEAASVALIIGNNNINGEDVIYTYTAESAGTLTLTMGNYLMAEVTTVVAAGGGEMHLPCGSSVELALAAGDVVTITVTANGGYATLTAEWAGESSGEPAVTTLALGDNILELAEGDMDGESWTFTATEAGTLTATVTNLSYYFADAWTESSNSTDLAAACGRMLQFVVNGNNAYTNTQSVAVAAGDVVTVQLINNYSYQTKATVNLAMGEAGGEEVVDPNPDLYEGSGTSADPYVIPSLAEPVTLTIVADTYFQYTAEKAGTIAFTDSTLDAGMLFQLNSGWENGDSVEVAEGDVLVINPYNSGSITIGYAEPADATVLTLGDNSVALAEGDMDGESWTYTAAEAGTLTATVSYMSYYFADAWYESTASADLSGACGRMLQFLVNGNNAYTNTQSVDVAAGDTVTIQLINNFSYETKATITLAMGEAGEEEEVVDPNPDLYEGTGTSDDPYIIPSLAEAVTLTVVSDIYFQYTAEKDGTIEYTDSSCEQLTKVNDGAMSNASSHEVVAGDVLLINTWGEGTITVGYAAGGETGDAVVVASGSASADADSKDIVSYTPAENGTLTITVGDGTTNWASDVYNASNFSVVNSLTGSAEASYTAEVTAGNAYFVRFYAADNGVLAATPYTVTFTASGSTGGDVVTKEDYIISEQVITAAGTHTVEMIENAEVTIVTFTPAETGYYTITVPEGALIGNCGAGSFYIYDWDTIETGTSIEWVCQEVASVEKDTIKDEDGNDIEITRENEGQSMMLGIVSDSASVDVTITKTGEYVDETVELQTYVNKAELSQFELPEGAELGGYVDVYGETHTAVVDRNGYYHLDSVDGPVLLVDMNHITMLSEALNGGRGVMYAYVTDENGKVIEKWDIGAAVKAYEAVCDENYYYPLTEDLIFFYDTYAADAGIYQYHLEEGYNEECAWMFACRTMTTPAPEAPVVTGKNVASTGKIRLSWDAVEGADYYKVYRSTSKTGTYKLALTTSGTSYTNTSAKAGTTYYYYVVAISEYGAVSAQSNIVTRTCDCAQPVVTATNVASSGKIKLTWDAVEGAVSYKVYRSTKKSSGYKLMKTVTGGTTYTNTSAEAGTTYYYYVVAVGSKSAANSAKSAVVIRTCDLPRPVVSISNVASSGKIKLTWEAVEGAVSYKVYRATSKNGEYKLMKTTTGTTYTNTSAKAGTTYYYKVVAVAEKSAANSAYSSYKSRTCDLPRPDVSISLKSKKPRLTWDEVDGAVSYKIYRSTSKNGTYSLIKTTTAESYRDTTAKSGKTYYYKVIAVHSKSAANSAYSLVDSIKSK